MKIKPTESKANISKEIEPIRFTPVIRSKPQAHYPDWKESKEAILTYKELIFTVEADDTGEFIVYAFNPKNGEINLVDLSQPPANTFTLEKLTDQKRLSDDELAAIENFIKK